MSAGVVDDEIEGVITDAGVKGREPFGTVCCSKINCEDVGDGRLDLAEPLAKAGEEDVAEGAMLGYMTME